MISTESTEAILKMEPRWKYERTDRNGTRYFRDWRCNRCGGRGGWEGWPGFTCYDCGLLRNVMTKKKLIIFAPLSRIMRIMFLNLARKLSRP